MPDFDALPFPIGSTMGVTGSTDQAQWEGREFRVPDLNYAGGGTPDTYRTYSGVNGEYKTIRIVRNVSTITLAPRRLVTYKSTKVGQQVDGYCNTLAGAAAGLVDEFLSANVAINDLFYIVVEGKAEGQNNGAADITSSWAVGSLVVAATANGSTNTTGGKLGAYDLVTGVTGATLGNQVANRLGVALTASTTSETGKNVLVNLRKLYG